jgi:hypothetical protein
MIASGTLKVAPLVTQRYDFKDAIKVMIRM